MDKGVEGIVTTWKQEISRAVGKKRAIRLMAAAKDSIGLTEGLIMAKQEITSLLAQYKALEQEIDNLMIQIENILKEIPGTAEMMSIPGVGMVTVAGFLCLLHNINGQSCKRNSPLLQQ
jgi:transposase